MQVEKFQWDLGTEPRGWHEQDRIVLSRGALPGFYSIVRTPVLTHALESLYDDEPPVFAVNFHVEARVRVLHWLRKFANPEDYTTISKQIT